MMIQKSKKQAFRISRFVITSIVMVSLMVGLPSASQASEGTKKSCKMDDDAVYSNAHLENLVQGASKIRSAALKNIQKDIKSKHDLPKNQTTTSSVGIYMAYFVLDYRLEFQIVEQQTLLNGKSPHGFEERLIPVGILQD